MMEMFMGKGNDMDEDCENNSSFSSELTKYIDIMHGSDGHHPQGFVVTAPFPCQVVEVLIKEGMELRMAQPILKVLVPSSYVPFQTYSEVDKSNYKNHMEGRSRVGIYPLADVLVDLDASSSGPASSINFVDIMERYENFKRFDVVVDDSDHLFSSYPSAMQHPDWANRIKEERRILEEHLPETIFVRVYESRMDLLRAVIIGPHGTPYQDGLFFFDVFFPENYPSSPPLVRYRSGGVSINPNIHKCGEVRLSLIASRQLEKLWGPGSNMLRLLVCIQDIILNTKPFFNGFVNSSFRDSVAGEWLSLLYNENTIVKSLKTMVHTMHNPPKNFEDLVVGHFRKRVRDILMACKSYTEGLQIGCLVCDINETCSSLFKKDVFLCLEPLVEAFFEIRAHEADEIHYQILKKRLLSNEKLEDVLNKKRKAYEAFAAQKYESWNVFAYKACTVGEVLVKDGMKIEEGQPLYAYNEAMLPFSSSTRLRNSPIRKILNGNHSSRVGMFSMEDVLVDQDDDDDSSPMAAGLDDEDVLKRYKNFKKFESVMDYSDHFFSADCSAINQPPKDWVNMIYDERRFLEEHLPENLFVRVYESRIDLLRAVIIGPEGTPYHGGLFFFDVCFPSNYPNSPPLVHYHSGGLGVNPNLYKCGKVRLSLPKTNGGKEMMWVPDTSTLLQLLVSIQNRILNAEPLFNDLTYGLMRGSRFGVEYSYLYNETILIKSLKMMVYTMNKPPKNFEDFVVGHFRNRACDIIQVACRNKTGSLTIKNDLFSYIRTLLAAFTKIGTKRNEFYIKEKE